MLPREHYGRAPGPRATTRDGMDAGGARGSGQRPFTSPDVAPIRVASRMNGSRASSGNDGSRSNDSRHRVWHGASVVRPRVVRAALSASPAGDPLTPESMMFTHNKQLQYTVRVSEPNPALANLLLEQFGGPQGELAAAMRYFTQALAEDDPGRKDMLLDISTEELSHLEVIGSLVGMLNKGAKGRMAEGVEEEGELFRSLQGAGNDSHVTQVLFGGGPALVNSGGQLWTAGYIDSI